LYVVLVSIICYKHLICEHLQMPTSILDLSKVVIKDLHKPVCEIVM